jgi:hypothetical protein
MNVRFGYLFILQFSFGEVYSAIVTTLSECICNQVTGAKNKIMSVSPSLDFLF